MIPIFFLKEKPDFISTIAEWAYNEWYDKNKTTLEDVIIYYNNFLNDDEIPLCLVAVENEKPVGNVCLWENDLKSRKDLKPWLAALFVSESYRNQGIGRLLITKLILVCKKLGYNKLYLHTETAYDYYNKLNWKFLEVTVNDKGEKTYIFEYVI